MWHALRAELAYFRTFLAVAWSIAIGVAVMINLLSLLGGGASGDQGGVLTGGLPGIFLVIASMIVGFIAQGTRSEERRARLLLAGPLTPRQLGMVMVLLPACLVGLGVLAGGLLIGVASLIAGELELTPVRIVGAVAAQMFAIVEMGPLAQESTAARRQRRRWAAWSGWSVFVVAILVLAAVHTFEGWIEPTIGQVGLAAVVMATSASLYVRRSDFTR